MPLPGKGIFSRSPRSSIRSEPRMLKESIRLAAEEGPEKILESLTRRVREVDSKVNAYVQFDPKKIQRSQSKGPLAGVPVSVKDNICTRGWETTCASKILKGFIPPYDATVIQKLRETGTVILGKCNMDEFAFGSSCET